MQTPVGKTYLHISVAEMLMVAKWPYQSYTDTGREDPNQCEQKFLKLLFPFFYHVPFPWKGRGQHAVWKTYNPPWTRILPSCTKYNPHEPKDNPHELQYNPNEPGPLKTLLLLWEERCLLHIQLAMLASFTQSFCTSDHDQPTFSSSTEPCCVCVFVPVWGSRSTT